MAKTRVTEKSTDHNAGTPDRAQTTGSVGLKALEALKQRLHEDVASLRQVEEGRTPYGGDFESLVAAAQLASQQETDELLRLRLERRLAELERIRRRVDEGKYGLCESCGAEIPDERLEAMPDTTLCVRCQSQRERRGYARRAA